MSELIAETWTKEEMIDEGIYSDFKHSYSIRLIAYFIKARVNSKDDYMSLYRLYINQKDVTVPKIFMAIIYSVRFIPSFLLKFTYKLGTLLLRKSGWKNRFRFRQNLKTEIFYRKRKL